MFFLTGRAVCWRSPLTCFITAVMHKEAHQGQVFTRFTLGSTAQGNFNATWSAYFPGTATNSQGGLQTWAAPTTPRGAYSHGCIARITTLPCVWKNKTSSTFARGWAGLEDKIAGSSSGKGGEKGGKRESAEKEVRLTLVKACFRRCHGNQQSYYNAIETCSRNLQLDDIHLQ